MKFKNKVRVWIAGSFLIAVIVVWVNSLYQATPIVELNWTDQIVEGSIKVNYELVANPTSDDQPYTLYSPKYIRTKIPGNRTIALMLWTSTPTGVSKVFNGGYLTFDENSSIMSIDFATNMSLMGRNLVTKDGPFQYKSTIFPTIWERVDLPSSPS